MSGLLGILHVARSGIMAQQTAVRVASQNISNAQTEGYTRQRADLVTADSITTPLGILGSGVRVDNVSRIRDPLLDANFRRDSGRAASSELRFSLLDQVQQVLGEPSETGLSTALDAFSSSWSELSSQPNSVPIRSMVIQRGEQLATMFRGFSTKLDETASYAGKRLTAAVTDINRYAGQIAAINVDIVRTEAGGQTAADLRDQRDRLLDSMSKLGTVRVVERGPSDIAVLVDGAMVVEGSAHTDLTVGGPPSDVRINNRALNFSGAVSTMGDLLDVINTQIPAVQTRLDTLAGALVEQVNALHGSGYTPGGATGVNFFTTTGTTARTIAVSATAAQVVTTDVSGSTGNNKISLALAALRGKPADNSAAAGYAAWAAVSNNLGGIAFGDHYNSTVTQLATVVSDAQNSSTVYDALSQQAGTRRASVSGVSTDEELILVMQHQQAYSAAARLVSVVDDMMKTLLSLT